MNFLRGGEIEEMTVHTVDTYPVAIGKNPERSREHNRRVVLDLVRQDGSLGRAQIAKITHLTAQAVANIVDELVGEELLKELGCMAHRQGPAADPVRCQSGWRRDDRRGNRR